MWVCRAGNSSVYYKKFICDRKIYIPWDGYKYNLHSCKDLSDFKLIVEKEKGTINSTTISNWASQLYSFVCKMELNDYVLIPAYRSREYCLAQIVGQYEFLIDDSEELCHSRAIVILKQDIPREIFTKDIQYSLGAYRTIFRANKEREILQAINDWK